MLTGVAMTVVRLMGCDVGCPFCDTKETWAINPTLEMLTPETALGANTFWMHATAGKLARYITSRFYGPKWVMLTGGEPALQNLRALTAALQDAQRRVCVETSGTADGHMRCGIDWVTVSPKLNMPGKKPLVRQVMENANEIKWVIGKRHDLTIVDEIIDLYDIPHDTVMSLQPISQSKRATELCMRTAMNRGWNLSIQIHKYIDAR